MYSCQQFDMISARLFSSFFLFLFFSLGMKLCLFFLETVFALLGFSFLIFHDIIIVIWFIFNFPRYTWKALGFSRIYYLWMMSCASSFQGSFTIFFCMQVPFKGYSFFILKLNLVLICSGVFLTFSMLRFILSVTCPWCKGSWFYCGFVKYSVGCAWFEEGFYNKCLMDILGRCVVYHWVNCIV